MRTWSLVLAGFFGVFITTSDNRAQDFLWAKQLAGGANGIEALGVGLDAAGNVYSVGAFGGTVDFDPGPGAYNLTTVNVAGFISKLDSGGNFVWARQFTGTGEAFGTGVGTDAAGNVYTVGYFTGTADFDPGPGTYNLETSGTAVFISKLDSSGNFIWAKQFEVAGTSVSNGNGIAIDAVGNVYTVGVFQGAVDFDPGPGTYNLTSAGGAGFLSKLDGAGNFVWAMQWGGSVGGISLDAAGNVYTPGSKLDSAGHVVWTGGGGSAVSVDAAGDVYNAGYFTGTVDFDPGPGTYNLTTSSTHFEGFISKLDSGGAFIWARQFGGVSGDTLAQGVSVDAAGNVFAAGDFGGTADFDPGPGTYNLTSAQPSDGFILKLDNGGNFVWAAQLGGANDSEAFGVTLDAIGNVYTVGYFTGTADFDPGPGTYNLTSAGPADAFIWKLTPQDCTLQSWYRDADGDGHGNPAASVQSCAGAAQAGFVANGSDCNDADARIYAGAPEKNDGVDNQCSGDAGYGIIDEIDGTMQVTAGGMVCFSDASGAASYEVARSSNRSFSTCLILGTATPANPCLTDPTNPPPSGGFYYLVRAVTPHPGSWGQDSAGHEIILSCTAGCVANSQCDDGNPCTSDVCDATSRCVHQNVSGPCSDGNACTTNDTCSGGVCAGGAALDCNDGTACTVDSCSPASGCVHTANNTLCDDGQSCTTDTCDPVSGCTHATLPNGAACDDSNACTANDQCTAGVCAGQPPAVASHLVISQFSLQGAGGESDEFVEIYNPTGTAKSLNGLSLQYKRPGQAYQEFAFPALSVPGHGWFLVVGSGYTGTVTGDAVNTVFQADSSVGGTLYFVKNLGLLAGFCPGFNIGDKVAWGTVGDGNVCPEGNVTNTPAGTASRQRLPGGVCGDGQDSDDNSADFVSLVPASPRNRFSPPQP